MIARISGIFIAVLAMLCPVGAAQAENYPYRDDMLWVAMPDHADWLYTVGDSARIDVQLYRYGVPVDDVSVEYEIGPDMMPSCGKGSFIMTNGHGTVNIGTMEEPGFLDCRMSVNIDGMVSRHHVKVGFSPEKIEPYTSMPDDFVSFWDGARKELDKVGMSYTITPVPEYSTERFSCDLVKLIVSRQGQAIYGYLFIPKEASVGSCPIVISPPGAGIKPIKDPLAHRYYAENGCIRFEMEIHGLHPDMPAEYFADVNRAFGGRENGYLHNGLDHRDNYYMKRVYLSLLRASDFLSGLPEWDGRNLIYQGGSQGGALAIVGAALDSRATACVANHPALSDMAGYMAGRAGGYPHFFRTPGMDTPEKLSTMAYYDVVNFARQLTVPVYMTWGYNDNTCPPTTSYAVYNVISSPKDALITPVNEHWTSDATERGHLTWILSHLK